MSGSVRCLSLATNEVDFFFICSEGKRQNVTRANHRLSSFSFSPSISTGENQSKIYLNLSINTCCICFFSISVGRKQSQSSVYVNQCSVGGRVMTLVCKNNTSSTRERAFAFASFCVSPPLSLSSLLLYLAHNTSCP